MGAGDGIALEMLDRRSYHEIELAVVIGRRARRVTQKEALDCVAGLAPDFADRGALVISAGLDDAPGIRLPSLKAHPALQPLLQVQSFYRLANALAIARGRDPDRPPHLAKVTETV